ncbi:MAG: transporter substrate-binding domain-containing protein [Pseudomonadota bacterium]
MHILHTVKAAFSAIALLAACLGAARAETVTVYTNATFPPLVVDAKIGLYPELVGYLNGLKPGGLEFVIETLPRKRLQVLVESGALDGIVIGMMPAWMGDPNRVKYLWTDPFANDSFVMASTTANPVLFNRIDERSGVRVGVTMGYVYPMIDEWIARHGLTRDEAPTEERNLDKLMLGRVDAVIVAESVLRYYTKTHRMTSGIIIEPMPGQVTERRFLVPKSKQAVYDKLAPVIMHLNADPAWRKIQSQY